VIGEKDDLKDIVPYIDEDDDEPIGHVSNNSMEYYMEKLTPLQMRFVNLYMTGQYTFVEIGHLLNVSDVTIRSWFRKEHVKKAIEDITKLQQQVVAVNISALTVKAIQKMNDLLDSPIDGVKYQAAKDLLDRGGHKAKQEIKVDKTVTYEEKLNQIIDDYVDAEILEECDEDE